MGRRPPLDFRTLFETIPGLYLVLAPDDDFTIEAATDAYLEATLTTRAIFGRPLFEVFPDAAGDGADGAQNLRRSLETVIATRSANAMHVQKYSLRRPDGTFEERYWSPLNLPVLGVDGEIDRIVHRVEDVTAFVRAASGSAASSHGTEESAPTSEVYAAAREIQRANEVLSGRLDELQTSERTQRAARTDLETTSRMKDEFLATVSHELRTPLNAILGWTTTLRRKKPAHDIDRVLAIIERNARAQGRLIEDVLDSSRIISGKLRLEIGATNVGEVVSAAIEAVRPAADAKRVRLSLDVASDVGIVAADPDRLQQVIWNLASNAVKFTPEGEEVRVRAFREGGKLRLVVEDRGEGIGPEFLPHVFEPFRQADGSSTRKHGGLGLGLAIVKQLVAAHGGTVEASSAGLGCGSRFSIALPTPAVEELVRRRAHTSEFPIPEEAAALTRVDGLKVLILDDEADARALLDEVLREHGALVRSASSALEALAALRSFSPDVIVSDLGMPGVDGYSLLRRIRAFAADEGGRTPAIALSAYTAADDVRRALASGFQAHLAKPFDPAQLLALVANLGGRTRDEP